MNARPCWAETAERDHLKNMAEIVREQDEKDEVVREITNEIRALFERAWKGEAVLFPVVRHLNPAHTLYITTLAQAVGDAVADDNSAANRWTREASKPGADTVFCIGSFREAVVDQYIADHASDLANNRLGWDK